MRLRILLLAAIPLLLPSPAAQAADPDAPPGAHAQWLPQEEWVMEQWLPFDERHLLDALGVTRQELWQWVHTDRRSITQLALRRGLAPNALEAALLARRGAVPPAAAIELRKRTRRVLSQPHLSHHILFHEFHHWSILRHAPRIFGVSSAADYERLFHHRFLSPGAIARRNGRGRARVHREAMAVLDAAARRGVDAAWMSAGQARALRDHQLEAFDRWLATATGTRPATARASSATAAGLLCALPHVRRAPAAP